MPRPLSRKIAECPKFKSLVVCLKWRSVLLTVSLWMCGPLGFDMASTFWWRNLISPGQVRVTSGCRVLQFPAVTSGHKLPMFNSNGTSSSGLRCTICDLGYYNHCRFMLFKVDRKVRRRYQSQGRCYSCRHCWQCILSNTEHARPRSRWATSHRG